MASVRNYSIADRKFVQAVFIKIAGDFQLLNLNFYIKLYNFGFDGILECRYN
jgi:hypothetical protein